LLATLPAKLLAGGSGAVVDSIGYFNFFIYASSMGIPAIILSFYLQSRQTRS
jgi:PAT family beta-lactamase induction signal transducer AmpG